MNNYRFIELTKNEKDDLKIKLYKHYEEDFLYIQNILMTVKVLNKMYENILDKMYVYKGLKDGYKYTMEDKKLIELRKEKIKERDELDSVMVELFLWITEEELNLTEAFNITRHNERTEYIYKNINKIIDDIINLKIKY